MLISVPSDIPCADLARALATLGLTLEPKADSGAITRAHWSAAKPLPVTRLEQSCTHPGCHRPASVAIGGTYQCATHALPQARREALL